MLHRRDELNHGGGGFAGAPPYMGGFLFLHHHLQTGRMQGAIVIQLLLNLGVSVLGILHGNTLLLEAL